MINETTSLWRSCGTLNLEIVEDYLPENIPEVSDKRINELEAQIRVLIESNRQLIKRMRNLEERLPHSPTPFHPTSQKVENPIQHLPVPTPQRMELLKAIKKPIALKHVELSSKATNEQVAGVPVASLQNLILEGNKIIKMNIFVSRENKLEALECLQGLLDYIKVESISRKSLQKKIEKESFEPDLLVSFMAATFQKSDEVSLDEFKLQLEQKIKTLEEELEEEFAKRKASSNPETFLSFTSEEQGKVYTSFVMVSQQEASESHIKEQNKEYQGFVIVSTATEVPKEEKIDSIALNPEVFAEKTPKVKDLIGMFGGTR